MGRAAFGRIGGILVNTALLSYQIGCCCTYQIFISSNLNIFVPSIDARVWMCITLALFIVVAMNRPAPRTRAACALPVVCRSCPKHPLFMHELCTRAMTKALFLLPRWACDLIADLELVNCAPRAWFLLLPDDVAQGRGHGGLAHRRAQKRAGGRPSVRISARVACPRRTAAFRRSVFRHRLVNHWASYRLTRRFPTPPVSLLPVSAPDRTLKFLAPFSHIANSFICGALVFFLMSAVPRVKYAEHRRLR